MNNFYNIAISILIYELKIPYETNDALDLDAKIKTVMLYSPDMEFEDNMLIIGTISETMTSWDKNQNCFFLCIRDRFPDDDEKNARRNVAILRTNSSISRIFNATMSIYGKILNWNIEMNISVLQNRGMQALVDLSENILQNHISVLDATFKLLAYSKNIEIEDEVTNALIKNGYHDEKTIRLFKEVRRIEEFEQNDDIIISTDHKVSRLETVKRVFHMNNKIHFYVVMNCNARTIDPGILALFKNFLYYMEKYAGSNLINPSSFSPSQQLLRDLIEKKVSSIDEAARRAQYASIPFHSKYVFFMIHFHDHFNVPLESLVLTLSTYTSNAYVLTVSRNIAIIQQLKDNQKHINIKEKMEALLGTYLKENPCIVGMSNVFETLWQIPEALEQAGCAIEYGAHAARSIGSIPSNPVAMFDFEESFLTLMVAKGVNTSPGLFANSFTVTALEQLENYDFEHGTELVKTLDAYLFSGRKATEVCNMLHMHRNTILYHIERIETILDISLSNQETCIKLMLGLLMKRTHMQDMINLSTVYK